MKEISASFYLENKWLQTRKDPLLSPSKKSWVAACISKTLLEVKISQVLSTQLPQRYIERLITKAWYEIRRAEPTIRSHLSRLHSHRTGFPESNSSIATELLPPAARPSCSAMTSFSQKSEVFFLIWWELSAFLILKNYYQLFNVSSCPIQRLSGNLSRFTAGHKQVRLLQNKVFWSTSLLLLCFFIRWSQKSSGYQVFWSLKDWMPNPFML